MKDYQFNVNWFNNYSDQWVGGRGYVKEFVGKPVNFLQVGCFEGMGTTWMLDNILTHPDAKITDVDPFHSDGDLVGANFDTVWKLYQHNIKEQGEGHKVTLYREESGTALRKLPLNSFDFIFVDGSHLRKDVLEDAILCHRLLKNDGIIIFDDYGWGLDVENKAWIPQQAIDTFLEYYLDYYKLIDATYQAVMRKIKET